jgi:hypothetical protein
MTIGLKETQTISEIAKHLYDYLPGKAHPYADQTISFIGAARAAGAVEFWPNGSKLPSITKLLEMTLEHKRSFFCKLIVEIVRRGISYRNSKGNPIFREDIETLNQMIVRINFKIPELWDIDFLDTLSRRETPVVERQYIIKDEVLFGLKDKLIALRSINPIERGFAFEKILADMFACFDLSPRGSFRLQGEQIDGSFNLDGETYLVEAKWRNSPSAQEDLLIFSGKVGGKAVWSRGLFISYSGFTPDGLEAFSKKGATSIIGMDGRDLWFIVDGKRNLKEVIQAKARHAAETGTFYIPVFELMA